MFLYQRCQEILKKRKERYQRVIEPWRFREDHIKYHVFFGLFHVKFVIITFTIAKMLFILWYILSSLIEHKTGVLTLATCFALFMITASYTFLIIGVVTKKYTFIIPYFTICVMLILVLTLKVFIEVMASANTKTTLNKTFMNKFILQSSLILMEIYSVVIVLKVFNYITDYYMEEEFVKLTKIAEIKKQIELDLEEAKARRREKAERLKELENEPVRKPTFPQIAALLEEVKLLHSTDKEKKERRPSEVSSSSSDSK